MKVKVSTWRITWRYLIVVLILDLSVFAMLSSSFVGFNRETRRFFPMPWGTSQIIITAFLIGIPLALYFITIFNYYYVIEDKSFVVKKYGRTLEYQYKNIEFIDINESRRKKQVIFYAPTCRTVYLLADKENKLLETLIKKCPNTLTVEEFRAKHPEEKY